MSSDLPVSFELHRTDKVFVDLASAWSALAGAAGTAHPFAGPGFARAWWTGWGRGRQMLVASATDAAGRVLALLPLRFEPERDEVRFLVDGRADYATGLAEPGFESLLRRLLDLAVRESGARRAVLRRMPSASPATAALVASSGRVRSVDVRRLPGVATQDPGNRIVTGEELLALAGSLDRYSSARHLRWYEARGGLRHEVVTDRVVIAARLDELFALHRRDFADRGLPSLFDDPAAVDFYRALVGQADLEGVLRYDVLETGGRPVALHLGFETTDSVLYYKPAMDPGERSRRPGRLLLAHMASQTLASGRRELDLLSGDEAYKQQIATTLRGTTTLVVAGSRRRVLRARLGRGLPLRRSHERPSPEACR